MHPNDHVLNLGHLGRFYGTSCDLCSMIYYSERKGANKRRYGPLNLVCHHCYEWSVPKSGKTYQTRKPNVAFRMLEGTPYTPKTTGESFSRSWSQYKTPGKRNQWNKNERNKTTETVGEAFESSIKDAVHLVESGVSNLLRIVNL